MTEINERLARFAELHRNEPNGGTWWDKDGCTVDIPFTESLDAQAKYLWPRLDAIVRLYKWHDGWMCELLDLTSDVSYAEVEAPTPALASAQAIAKLLEGKA